MRLAGANYPHVWLPYCWLAAAVLPVSAITETGLPLLCPKIFLTVRLPPMASSRTSPGLPSVISTQTLSAAGQTASARWMNLSFSTTDSNKRESGR